MMKRIYLLFLVVAIAACERELEVDLSGISPELVVVANFSDLDTLEVVVSKTRPALDPGPPLYIPDATVHIYEEGVFADRLSFIPSPIPQYPAYYLSSFLVPQPGKKYRIFVSAPGLAPVEAESEIPNPVEIDPGVISLSVEETAIDSSTAQVSFSIDLTIPLPVPKPSFFHLNFYQEVFSYQVSDKGDTIKSSFYSIPLVFSPKNPDLPFIPYIEDRGVLFGNDALFNNHGRISFSGAFQYRPQEQLLGDFFVELRTTSQEYYLYHRSLARLSQAGNDPFSEPVVLYSNVINGQGVFAAFTAQFYPVDMPR